MGSPNGSPKKLCKWALQTETWLESAGSLLGVRWESAGSPLRVPWESPGSPLGVCWESAGSLLGVHWESIESLLGVYSHQPHYKFWTDLYKSSQPNSSKTLHLSLPIPGHLHVFPTPLCFSGTSRVYICNIILFLISKKDLYHELSKRLPMSSPHWKLRGKIKTSLIPSF